MKGEEETQGVNFFQKGSWFLLGFLSVFDIVSESVHRLLVFHDFFSFLALSMPFEWSSCFLEVSTLLVGAFVVFGDCYGCFSGFRSL